jgi:hypothetical protein
MKDFDRVFFEFSDKKSKETNLILTKEAFYKYTIQIAAFFRSIGVLYPDQKKWLKQARKNGLLKAMKIIYFETISKIIIVFL